MLARYVRFFFVAFGLLTHHDDSTLSLRAWYACSRCLGGPVRLCCFPVSLGDISGDRGHSLKPLCFFLYPDQVRFFFAPCTEYLVPCVSVISKSPSSPRGTGDVEAIIVIPRVYLPNA